MNKLLAALMLALALVPMGAAQYPDTQYTYDTKTYVLHSIVNTAEDITTGGTEVLNGSFINGPANDFELINYTLRLRVTSTTIFQADNPGEWNMTVEVDGVSLPGCAIHIHTLNPGGFLSGDLPVYTFHDLTCIYRPPNALHAPTLHNVTITARIDEGAPSTLLHTDSAVVITREDRYMIPQDTNEITQAIELYWPIFAVLFFLAMFRKAESNAEAITALTLSFATIVLATVLAPVEEMRLYILALIFLPLSQVATLLVEYRKNMEPEEDD